MARTSAQAATARTRGFASPLFIGVSVVLLIAAIGMPIGLKAVSDHFTKLPVDVRVPLSQFDGTRLTSFRVIPTTRILHEGQDIGTDEALTIPLLMDSGLREDEERHVLLHVAYYDGTSLQVSHTPEVCYRQSGAVINEIRTIRIPVSGIAGVDSVPARLVDITVPGGVQLAVVYLFVSNGSFYHDRERLRFAMSWADEPRVYFAKVEAVTEWGNDGFTLEDAAEYSKKAIIEALPELLDVHLPTHEDLMRVDAEIDAE
jgi:hypothetical protein